MKILVLWADDRSTNLGVRALAAGTAVIARNAFDEPEVDFQDFGRNAEGFVIGRKEIVLDVLNPRGPIKKFMRKYDLILDTGAGDSFSDIYGIQRLFMMVYAQSVAAGLGIPIVQTPQTIGPFKSVLGRVLGKHALGLMKLVIARDGASARYALEMGTTVDFTTTDVVFALPVPVTDEKRDVVVNVSGLLWNPNPHVDNTSYRNNVLTLVRELQGLGRRVSLLAHVIQSDSADNDVPAIEEVAAQVEGGLEVLVPTDLNDVRRIVASANLVIGSRMHACLNALSVGTPALPWAYSRKFAPLMQNIGWQHSVDLRAALDPVAETISFLSVADQTETRDQLIALRATVDLELDRTTVLLSNLMSEGRALA